ncbi:hypothetical protein, partial [Photobacterium minamisatsumaniensis]|uniref:hypothetical protein n=1 Tax=Photobacterium minamisatsumaniensis TaxID=2910233 RepID=UPI003D126D2E
MLLKIFLGLSGVIFSLIFSILVVRLLSVEDRAVYQLMITGAQFSFILGSFGIPFARALLEGKKNKSFSFDKELLCFIPIVSVIIYFYTLYY